MAQRRGKGPGGGAASWRGRHGPLIRYTLLQIPGLLLIGALCWWGYSLGWLSAPLAVTLFVLWLIKDVVLYPLYRPALEADVAHGAQALVGCTAVVIAPLDPVGGVRIRGERWRARAEDGAAVPAGATVRVTAAAGLTLIVRPESQPPGHRPSTPPQPP